MGGLPHPFIMQVQCKQLHTTHILLLTVCSAKCSQSEDNPFHHQPVNIELAAVIVLTVSLVLPFTARLPMPLIDYTLVNKHEH